MLIFLGIVSFSLSGACVYLFLDRQKLKLLLENEKRLIEEKEKQFVNTGDLLKQSVKSVILEEVSKIDEKAGKRYTEERENLLKNAGQMKDSTLETAEKKFKELAENLTKSIESHNEKIGNLEKSSSIITKSFIGGSQAGKLGEIGLYGKLQSLGLEENVSFFTQFQTINGLRPDAVVLLPKDDFLVIDSKSSTLFAECESQNEEEQNKRISERFKKHINDLYRKDYIDSVTKALKEKTHKEYKVSKDTFTILYVPTDYALEKVKTADSNIQAYARDRNVILCGPSALEAILEIASYNIKMSNAGGEYQEKVEELKMDIKYFFRALMPIVEIGKGLKDSSEAYYKFLQIWSGAPRVGAPFHERLQRLFKDEKESDVKKLTTLPEYHFTKAISDAGDSTDL